MNKFGKKYYYSVANIVSITFVDLYILLKTGTFTYLPTFNINEMQTVLTLFEGLHQGECDPPFAASHTASTYFKNSRYKMNFIPILYVKLSPCKNTIINTELVLKYHQLLLLLRVRYDLLNLTFYV